MPAIREKTTNVTKASKPMAPALVALAPVLKTLDDPDTSGSLHTSRDFAKESTITYPKGNIQREAYRTKDGKRITAHHWAVYDLVLKIPVGSVSTYKNICLALGQGSPRSVGTALRNNPFAPYIPCHRIVASNRSVGGFCGEWDKKNSVSAGKKNAREKKSISHCDWKVRMLALEGVEFDSKGYLVDEGVLWKP